MMHGGGLITDVEELALNPTALRCRTGLGTFLGIHSP